MSEMVVLVDEQDNPVGLMEKMAAHEQGLLHRALSVFIFNTNCFVFYDLFYELAW